MVRGKGVRDRRRIWIEGWKGHSPIIVSHSSPSFPSLPPSLPPSPFSNEASPFHPMTELSIESLGLYQIHIESTVNTVILAHEILVK